VAAIVFGAAAVTFGAGLATSLDRLASDSQDASLPVQVSAIATAAQQRAVVSALAAQPGTLHYVAVTGGQLSLPGLPDNVFAPPTAATRPGPGSR
jgi:hypothetical protein